MNISYSILLSKLIITIYLKSSLAKVVEGELDTNENWVFLTRFCFISKDGLFTFDVRYPKDYAPQNLLLYFDTQSQWPSVYKQPKTCEEKHNILINNNNQVINLTKYNKSHNETKHSGCILESEEGLDGQWYRCISQRMFKSYRERWWFIALDNCQSTKGLKLTYKLTMINSENNLWLKHFSADEFYILHTDVIFAVLYYLLFLASCFEAYALYSRHLFHVTYKMYLVSLLSECVGITLLCIYYALYAQYGYGYNAVKLFGRIMEAISTLLFLLLLILLAKGFTITRARLKASSSAKIGIFMTLYTITYAILFFHEQQYFDPGEVLYIYESPFGYGLIGLRLIGWGLFVYSIVFTLIHYPQKSSFFTRLFLMYSVWFISAPVVILISTFVVPKWMREKIINAVELLIAIEAHFIFFILTRPSAANRNFPFHVRTTQIAVMSKSGQTADTLIGGTLDHFNHYKYAPTRPYTQESQHAIFSVTNGVNNVSNNYQYPNAYILTNNNGLPIADC